MYLDTALDFDAGLECLLGRLRSGSVRRVMVVGATDTGKTWLCRRLGAWGWENGYRVGLLDFDLGQSTVGPPGCVGLQLPWEADDDLLFPTALGFLGYLSPAWDVGSVVEKGGLLDKWARERGYDLLVIDTSGMVSGYLAGLLKRTKIRRLRPDLVVALEREDETRHIFRGLGEAEERVLFLRPSALCRPRDRKERAEFRGSLLSRYFRESRLLEIDLDRCGLRRTSPRVPEGLSFLQEGHLLGLEDGAGIALSLALLEDLKGRTLCVRTPFRGDAELIREVSIGPSVLSPDGSLRMATCLPGPGQDRPPRAMEGKDGSEGFSSPVPGSVDRPSTGA